MKIYFPNLILNIKDIQENTKRYAIVVLNRPIAVEKELIVNLWNHSSIKITVDGGTNRWLSFLRNNELENKLAHPTIICGDLDSCNPESLEFFNKNTEVLETADQNETDFTKCLRVLDPFVNDMQLEFVVCICENTGRLDHILANINTLFKNQQSLPTFLLSSNSLSWLLTAGQHKIHIPQDLRKYWCSLVPIGHPCLVTTCGLKWNLTNHMLEYGGIVSTSNKFDGISEVVEITTDKPLLWSMGIIDEED